MKTMKKLSKLLSNKGFTLAELLLSSAIFITVSVVIVTALFIALRLSKKSDVLVVAKQNGDAAMSQMVRGIKYASSLDDPDSCVAPVITSQITVTSSSDNGQTTFSCPTDESNMIASNGASLMDIAGVYISTCSFSCTQSSINSPPTITIAFTLGTVASGSGFIESSTTIPFETSVTMRNFIR